MNIFHRDLKLENILIDSMKNIKIIDFGFSNFAGKLETNYWGTIHYAPPECIQEIPYDGQQADAWSLGVILFTLVSQTYPWKCGSVKSMTSQIVECKYEIPEYVSFECRDLIISLLRKNPSKRMKVNQIKYHKWLKNPCTKHIHLIPANSESNNGKKSCKNAYQ